LNFQKNRLPFELSDYKIQMTFFTPDFIAFFEELTTNNTRKWFQENKERFEKSAKNPFEIFIAEVIARVHELEPEVILEPKQAIFRIYRDIRFSKDKTPYKTHLGAVINEGGRKNTQTSGIYIQCNAERMVIGGGMYAPNRENLLQIRREIQANPKVFEKILNASDFQETYIELRGDKNKILPKEFKADQEYIPTLFYKQFFVMAEYPSQEVLFRTDLLDFVMRHYQIIRPLNDFLKEAVLT